MKDPQIGTVPVHKSMWKTVQIQEKKSKNKNKTNKTIPPTPKITLSLGGDTWEEFLNS